MIEKSEYRTRQQRFGEALTTAGFDGAVVVSRGGFTYDRAGAVAYLTGHYQAYVYLPDRPPYWSGRAHTILLTTAEGRSILCVSVPDFDPNMVEADDIRGGDDFAQVVIDALRDTGLETAKVALIGGDVLPATYYSQFETAGAAAWTPADQILDDLRLIKSDPELALIRRVCATNRKAVTAFADSLRPGMRESDAVAAAYGTAAAQGAAVYYAAASSGPMNWAYASKPAPGFSTRSLQSGDFVRFDLCLVMDGYLSDFGRTWVVGNPTSDQKRLIDTVHAALDMTIAAVRPGVSVRDVVAAGDDGLKALDVAPQGTGQAGTIESAYPIHWGHGLGLGWERPWMVDDETLTLGENMYLAIERTLYLPGVGHAAAEQNLLVTAKGPEVLTEGPEGRWS